MAFLTVLQNIENVRAIGEFRGLILATSVWFEVLVDFIFAICIFCYFENRKMLRLHEAHEPLVANKLTPACRGPFLINHRLSGTQT